MSWKDTIKWENIELLPEVGRRIKERGLSFSMGDYASNGDGSLSLSDSVNACNTTCCYLGWCPSVGIEAIAVSDSKDWEAYSSNVFGLGDCDDVAWYWLFSDSWTNDIDQCIRRAEYLIKHRDVPLDWDADGEDYFMSLDENLELISWG